MKSSKASGGVRPKFKTLGEAVAWRIAHELPIDDVSEPVDRVISRDEELVTAELVERALRESPEESHQVPA